MGTEEDARASWPPAERRWIGRFPRTVRALDDLVEFVAEFFRTHDLAGTDPFAIDLVVEELFTNMVKYNQGGQESIEVALARRGGHVEIRLRDFGVEPFDITRTPVVDPHARVSQGCVGGLGLHLVRRLCDDIRYGYADRTSTITVLVRPGRE